MKRVFLLLVVIALGACTQLPERLASSELRPAFGSDARDAAGGLARYASGVYVVGNTDGDLDGAQVGEGDAFIRKYTSNGALLWRRQFGRPKRDVVLSVASDSGDNAYVAGETTGDFLSGGAKGKSDIFLRKYTPTGEVAWTKQFGTRANDFDAEVVVVGNAVYVAATFGKIGGEYYNYDFDYNGVLVKFDTAGHELWRRNFGSPEGDYVEDIAVDASENIYVSGVTFGSFGGVTTSGYDAYVRKYKPDGTALWTRFVPDRNQNNVIAVSGHDVYLVTTFYDFSSEGGSREIRLTRFNSGGSKTLERVYDIGIQDSYVGDVAADSSGVVIVGANSSLYNLRAAGDKGYSDAFVMKVRPDGTYVWGQLIGTPYEDAAYAVLIRNSSEVYVAGSQGDYYPGPGGTEIPSDASVARLDAVTGAVVWTD